MAFITSVIVVFLRLHYSIRIIELSPIFGNKYYYIKGLDSLRRDLANWIANGVFQKTPLIHIRNGVFGNDIEVLDRLRV